MMGAHPRDRGRLFHGIAGRLGRQSEATVFLVLNEGTRMPAERLSMRRIRDVLRLKYARRLSERAIAASLGVGKGTVGACLGRARKAGLTWPLPETLSDDDLGLLLFPAAPLVPDGERPVPDWLVVDRDLRRPGVTRALLWEEYGAAHPLGFGYAWFCEHYEAWKGRVRPTMRQTHVGGEKVFADFAGDTVDVIDPETGEARAVKLFVAASRRRRASGTTGATNHTCAEAVASEGLEDWIRAHVGMFAFLGGVPKVVVPDNLKRGVFKACRFDPGLNRTYAEMAGHCGTAILPARPCRPRE
jgi:transposase